LDESREVEDHLAFEVRDDINEVAGHVGGDLGKKREGKVSDASNERTKTRKEIWTYRNSVRLLKVLGYSVGIFVVEDVECGGGDVV